MARSQRPRSETTAAGFDLTLGARHVARSEWSPGTRPMGRNRSLKLNHVGAGQRDLVNDRTRHSVNRKLVLIAVISGHSIHGHDHVEATQGGRNSREENAVMR